MSYISLNVNTSIFRCDIVDRCTLIDVITYPSIYEITVWTQRPPVTCILYTTPATQRISVRHTLHTGRMSLTIIHWYSKQSRVGYGEYVIS